MSTSDQIPAPQRLKQLRDGLLRLHKVLLDSEHDVYDHNVERVKSAGKLLDLVMNDPFFAWLRELSQLIVLVDETLAADEPPTSALADTLIKQSRALLTPAEEGSGFQKQYFEALQRDPNAVLAHGAMMKVFAGIA